MSKKYALRQIRGSIGLLQSIEQKIKEGEPYPKIARRVGITKTSLDNLLLELKETEVPEDDHSEEEE